MKTFRSRITWLFLFVIGCSVLGTGIFLALLLQSSYVDSLSSRLSKESEMIAETINWDSSEFQKQTEAFSKTLDARVTLFDSKGNKLGDSGDDNFTISSEHDWNEIEKEVVSSKDVVSVRRANHLIAAYPVIRGEEMVGIVRISTNLDEVTHSLSKVWLSLAGGLVIAYALAAFASSRVASSVTAPLEEITQVAVDIAQNRFHRRVNEDGRDEIGRLGRAINRMAHSLQFQMETIRKSERRLTSVIESMESGLLMVNTKGRISLANQSFEQMFGISTNDLVGTSYQKLSTSYDLSDLIYQCAHSGVRVRQEITLHSPTERILEASLAPMWVESNGVGVVAVFHDLTAIRRLEQMRKDFVANVSHELKTPITSIRGFSETLLDGAMQDPETCKDFLQIILDESIRLQRLVGDLLDLSSIESKQTKLNFEKVSARQYFTHIVKTLEDQARSKNQTLQVMIPNDFQMEVDPDLFKQIVLNLITNAMAYTPVEGKILLKVQEISQGWKMIVSDTGIGIPEDDLGRIFERFYRVDKARSRNSGGTGLGLAIVKHLVEEHQGEIDVSSIVGTGTTFTLTFPLQQRD